jgi:hypothetical protein
MTVRVSYEDQIVYAGYVNSPNLFWQLYAAYKFNVCKSEEFWLTHWIMYHMCLSPALGD